MSVRKRKKTTIPAAKKGIFTKVLLGLFGLSLLYVAGTVLLQQDEQLSRIQDRRQELNTELASAEAEYEEARSLYDSMGTDAFIEKIGREELGMLLPGEILFVD